MLLTCITRLRIRCYLVFVSLCDLIVALLCFVLVDLLVFGLLDSVFVCGSCFAVCGWYVFGFTYLVVWILLICLIL